MAQFNIAVTKAGRDLLAASVSGDPVVFSKAVLGEGTYTGDLSGMEAMLSPKIELEIGSVSRQENRVEIRVVLTMTQILEPFFWRELGIFATDPEGKEILVIYGNAGDKGDYLSNQDGILDEREILLSILVEQNEVVTDLSGVLFASRSDLEAHKADAAVHVSTAEKIYHLSHSKSDTVHQLTGLQNVDGVLSCAFTATAAYTAGDTFTVDGTPYTIQLSNGEAAEDNLFVSGATVSIILDTGAKKVNFKAAGSAKLPAGVMAIYKTFRSNGTFTAGVTGTYRITVIGHGGRGANAGHIQFKAGGGGAAGGVAQKTLKLNKGDSYPITVNSSQTSFGNIISAVQGGDASGYTGGTGGIGTGGDINYDGGNGETASTSNYASGGDGGAYTTEQINKIPILVNRGGSGGSGWTSGSDGSPPLQTSDIGFTPFGCGGGGGGAGDYDSGYREGSGASGAIGAVVVEYLG